MSETGGARLRPKMQNPLALLGRLVRRDPKPRTDADRVYDRKVDARTHDMVDGKGLDAEGNLISFESDSERPRR
jgi:hypothetical protein